jgi:hypothetical protein
MMLRRAPLLLFWLAIVLGAAWGMLGPGAARAHPGHAHPVAASQDEAVALAVAMLAGDEADTLAGLGTSESGVGESGAGERCTGAGCCTTGHGCCAAILGPAAQGMAAPPGGPPGPVLAGVFDGLGATAPPEPPRPFR